MYGRIISRGGGGDVSGLHIPLLLAQPRQSKGITPIKKNNPLILGHVEKKLWEPVRAEKHLITFPDITSEEFS